MVAYYFDSNRQIIGPVGPDPAPPEAYGDVELGALPPNTIVKGDAAGQLVDLLSSPRKFSLYDLPQKDLTYTYTTPLPEPRVVPTGQDQVDPMVFRIPGAYSGSDVPVDSPLVADRTRIITRIRMVRRTGGSASYTCCDVTVNGDSIVPPAEVGTELRIEFDAGNNAQVIVLPTSDTVRPGDVVQAVLVSADDPLDDSPNGLTVQVEFTPSVPGIPDLPPAAPPLAF